MEGVPDADDLLSMCLGCRNIQLYLTYVGRMWYEQELQKVSQV